jgi:hypothetical protein
MAAVAKFRLLSLFIFANAMGSLSMILPASPADRDHDRQIESDSHPARGEKSGAGVGRAGGTLSLLVAHDVLYEPCAGWGNCGDDHADRGNLFRPDLITGAPQNGLPFGGGADDGRGYRSAESGRDGDSQGSWSPGGFPSALFPFMPSAPFADAPGGGSRNGSSESGHGAGDGGSIASSYPGLGEGGSGGDWHPTPIPSGAGASGTDPSVSANNAIPEPASFSLLAAMGLMLMLFRRQRRRSDRHKLRLR